MRPIARILVDESHRQAWSTRPDVAVAMNPVHPADASYALAAQAARTAGMSVEVHASGELTPEALAGHDVLVIPHCADDAWERTTGHGSPRLTDAELGAVEAFVAAGGGLLVLAETEQAKYGNNLADLAARFGVVIDNATVLDPAHSHEGVATWVLADLAHFDDVDLAAQVEAACCYRAGTVHTDTGRVVARTSPTADPAGAGLVVAARHGSGRVVVTADSDLFGDDSLDDLDHRRLWLNLLAWSTCRNEATRDDAPTSPITGHPAWPVLVDAVDRVRAVQAKDGSVDEAHRAEAAVAVTQVADAIAALTPLVPHQAEHLRATQADLSRWIEGGLGVPDFLDSLLLFHPEEHRVHGIEHLVVFPMVTQNGNPNRNLEAVVTRTFWPDWLADLERDYVNAAFVPVEFVAFTAGYDTHSAVLFPETVATRSVGRFTWGAIFCDREAARFRAVIRAAAQQVRLALPPTVDLLLSDQRLAQETFAAWDLIHDRTHSRGDLPFDPFMIKQRMPYWMYALEELRCDLTAYRETFDLAERGVHLGPFIRTAILLDRLLRFPITGTRTRNYDGLGGQLLFASLHRAGAVRWTDNVLVVDWDLVDDAVLGLGAQVDDLYHRGIERSRVAQWLAAHEFVSDLVPAHPASRWAAGDLPWDAEPRLLVDAVLPDEFPLNVFYDALRGRLEDTVAATAGITG